MTHTDEKTLDLFRVAGPCEICDRWCQVREPAHWIAVAQGRLDLSINLLALGSTSRFSCGCHRAAHDGNVKYFQSIGKPVKEIADISRMMLLTIAARIDEWADDIEAVLLLIGRTDKDASADAIRLKAGELMPSGSARVLYLRTMESIGKFGRMP